MTLSTNPLKCIVDFSPAFDLAKYFLALAMFKKRIRLMQETQTEFKLWEDFVLASIESGSWTEFSGFSEELILAN